MSNSPLLIVDLRTMTQGDLEAVYAMRNHPTIRRCMFNQTEISMKEHQDWFLNASIEPKLELKVLYLNSRCSGFVQFRESAVPDIYTWGFYVAVDSPRGTGVKLGRLALTHAFSVKKAHKISGQTFLWNQSSINLHERLGFVEEGIARQQYYDGEKYHDVMHFGILHNEWLLNQTTAPKSQ